MGKLVALMITAFVDMVGFAMVLPLIPFYAASMGATGFVVGLRGDFSDGQSAACRSKRSHPR